MKRTKQQWICGLGFMILLIATGCSDDGMVDIAGQVTLDGNPVAQGTISFLPTDGKGASAEAVIKDGSYSLSMPQGKKRVAIHGFKKVGERYPWGKDNPPADILKEILPEEFNEKSEMTFDVVDDREDADFALPLAELTEGTRTDL